MRRRLLLVVPLALLAVLPPAASAQPAPAGEVRAFAVAWRHEVPRVESYDTFRTAVREQFDADIAPHLHPDRPNLVTYPEDMGLMAYYVGERGRASREILERREENASAAATASLAGPYAPQLAYYAAKFPDVDSPGQLLLLALTDTSGRAIVETFAELARDHGVWVTVSTNVADFERVEGPAAALLADPEADTSYAWEATSAEVYNQNLFFSPAGELVDLHKKAYLVPIERTRDVGLGMTGVEVDGLGVVDTPFGRVGTVTSKDAWMVDVNDRYDQLGASLLLQPEAFDTWGDPGEDLWPPDKFQRSGWLMTQRHPGLRANVTPMLTGNYGDLRFDGQPLIAVESPGGVDGLCLMGQDPEPGWAAVGVWNALDTPAHELCGEHRRAELRERALRMAPGSGDELENAYAEDVVWADLRLPAPPAARAARVGRADFAVSRPAPGDATQLVPALDGGLLAWIDFRRGNQSTYAARTGDGVTWSEPALVSDREVRPHDHFDNQWRPAVAADGDDALVAVLDFRVESWDLYRSRSADAGATWSANVRVDDAEPDEGTLRERGHSAPALVRDGDEVVAVWSDLRWPRVKPEVRLARSADWGQTWSASEPVAAGADAQDSPAAVLVSGDLLVAWQELADGVPLIRLSSGAAIGGPAFRPSLAADGEDVWLAYEQRVGDGSVIMLARSTDGGVTWGEPVQADPGAPAGVTQRHATVLPGGMVVFADDRAGAEDVLVAAAGAVQRVDDSPPGAHARAPAASLLDDSRLLVVWQETDVWQEADAGSETLRAAVGALPAGAAAPPP
jgi:predicted amidohydrolase